MGDRPRNGDNAPRAPLVELFRLGSTRRWQVVHMEKPQNVAEHSHMVAVITTRICQILNLDPSQHVMYALFHDAEEAWIGDIATPAKRMMNKAGLYTAAKKMLGPFFQYFEPKSELSRAIVKVADDVEALRYLARYADHRHGNTVAAGIADHFSNTMVLIRRWCGDPMADLIEHEMHAYIKGEGETYADDFI